MRKALNIPLEEFLRPFFDPEEKVCLRIFDDRKTGTFKGAKLEAAAGKIAAIADTLYKHNEKHRGIYFVVNFGGHEDTEITRINAQFMECDELSLEEQLRQIEHQHVLAEREQRIRELIDNSLQGFYLLVGQLLFDNTAVAPAYDEHIPLKSSVADRGFFVCFLILFSVKAYKIAHILSRNYIMML